MISSANCIATTSPSSVIAIQLGLLTGSVLLAWLSWAVLFPEALISRPFVKCFGYAQTVLQTRVASYTVQRLAPLGRWAMLASVRIFCDRKQADL